MGIHTIDPLHDGKVDEKATQLHAIASLKVLLDATKPQDNANGGAGGDTAHDSGRASQGTEEGVQQANAGALEGAGAGGASGGEEEDGEVQPEVLDMRFPIIFPLWLTLPDTRGERGKKFFAITFLGSIMW